MELTPQVASSFARIALSHVAREYPHKLDHVMDGDSDVLSPRALHPAFFGSYDWHSCVHGWWTLLTIRRLFPDIAEAPDISTLADATFSRSNLAVELEYAQRPSSRGFERPYGWAWLLYLHHEAERHTDKSWANELAPLAEHFAQMLRQYLGLLTYPITVGTHFNTAFALVLAREWASAHDGSLLEAIDDWAADKFGDLPTYNGWEPGGDEFLSPVLTVALLMRRSLSAKQFNLWFEKVLSNGGWLDRLVPASVSDRSDGKIAHLDGLNLSRAWCLNAIAESPTDSARSCQMRTLADQHLAAGAPHISGDYMGEHWLASFALLALLSAS